MQRYSERVRICIEWAIAEHYFCRYIMRAEQWYSHRIGH
jgi:hypothetical protein